MSASLPDPGAARHALLDGIRSNGQAKAGANRIGIRGKRKLGGALSTAMRSVGWSSKETAYRLEVDPADLSKMQTGERCVPVDRVLDIEELAWPFLVGLAKELGHAVEERITRRHPLPLDRQEAE